PSPSPLSTRLPPPPPLPPPWNHVRHPPRQSARIPRRGRRAPGLGPADGGRRLRRGQVEAHRTGAQFRCRAGDRRRGQRVAQGVQQEQGRPARSLGPHRGQGRQGRRRRAARGDKGGHPRARGRRRRRHARGKLAVRGGGRGEGAGVQVRGDAGGAGGARGCLRGGGGRGG
ncbi:hypothetical protein DFJ74DRAFT_770476, partial [Hyaloraphidium curvatum]